MPRSRRKLRRLALILPLAILALCIHDAVQHYIHRPSYLGIDSDVLVIDIDGVLHRSSLEGIRIVEGMSIADFRVIGLAKAKIIVFVGHGLELEGSSIIDVGRYALETSESPSWWIPLIHPILVITGSIAMGKIPTLGKERVVVTKNIERFAQGFDGKVVVLVTCGCNATKDFAEMFIDLGAKKVIYRTSPIPIENATEVIEVIAKNYRDLDRMLEELEKRGFEVLPRDSRR